MMRSIGGDWSRFSTVGVALAKRLKLVSEVPSIDAGIKSTILRSTNVLFTTCNFYSICFIRDYHTPKALYIGPLQALVLMTSK